MTVLTQELVSIEAINRLVREIIAANQDETGSELLVDVKDVEIVKTGIEYSLASGPQTFTPEDLADAVKAVENPNILNPRIVLGHDGPVSAKTRSSDQPSLGTVSNMHLDEVGQTILGDYKGIPVWLAEILASAYPSRSIEGAVNVKKNGHTYSLVIKAVSLLGVTWPGCSSIEDIQALYSKEKPDNVTVVAASGGPEAMGAVNASIQAEDVRRSFYEKVATGEHQYMWITAHYQSPQLLIAEDENGSTYHVKYSFAGDDVNFEDPIPVKIQYVEEDGGKVAARAEMPDTVPVAIFASREDSLNERNKKSPSSSRTPDPDKETKEITKVTVEHIKLLRARLGVSAEVLPDDATDEQLSKVLAETPQEEPPPAETPPAETPPAETPPEETPPAETPPAPTTEEAELVTAAQMPNLPNGMVLIDKEVWAGLQNDVKRHTNLERKLNEQERDQILAQAVTDGKFPPSRKSHYAGLYDKDPEGTKQFIASLAADIVPVEQRGTSQTVDWDEEDAYPSDWLPEIQASSVQVGGRNITVGGD